ncbi:leucyl-tRNA synthetase [Colletotrichum tofieldiae]|nr:leucyl-tRNA synthetase [Colletotrichum tofieldiae]
MPRLKQFCWRQWLRTAQHKKLIKGKEISFDPKLPYKLDLYYDPAFPTWQMDSIRQVSEALEKFGFVNAQDIGKEMDKGAMKRAKPFIQDFTKSLERGQGKRKVLCTEVPFDEETVLKAMVPGFIQSLPKCQAVDLIEVVGAEAQCGVFADSGQPVKGLAPVSSGATPDEPRFQFDNVA